MVDFNNIEYRTIILAAFLHDIGKLLGRGKFQMLDKGQHPHFSSLFVGAHSDIFNKVVDAALLKELVQKHHENQRAFPDEFLVQSIKDPHVRTLASLVSLADNLSSSERGESADKYQDYKKTALRSIMARLNQPGELQPHSFHPRALPEPGVPEFGDAIFPASFKEFNEGELNKLIESFGSSFSGAFPKNVDIPFESFYRKVTMLLYQYTWCIPSNTQENYPDISLYDHSRTTAAIAACLYKYHCETETLMQEQVTGNNNPRFLLVSGDIAGIQRYIFDIATSAAGGVARRLRARSLFIQMCSEVACHKILHRLNLPDWNVLMNSGGNFLLLVPALENSNYALEEIKAEVDAWFLNTMNAGLAINLSTVAFNDDGFRAGAGARDGFGDIVYQVKNRLNERKMRRFSDVLQDVAGWKSGAFRINLSFEGQAICDCCGKFPSRERGEDAGICTQCSAQGKLGSLLPSARYISYYDDPAKGAIEILGYSVSASQNPPDNKMQPYLVCQVNDPSVRNEAGYPVTSRYIASNVPRNGTEIMAFNGIAEHASGQKLLGFLKADVDNLGETFIFGLKQQAASHDTMSRLATLSRSLDLFFTGWTEHLVKTEYRHCYTVFSGGDDLFYVGPWDEILALVERINQDFRKFTGNQGMTLSAGVFIGKAGYPIARAADEAAEALKAAKAAAGKNSISVLGHTVSWTEWSDAKKEWQRLLEIDRSEGGLSSALMYNLQEFAAMWQGYLNGNTLGLRFHPLLSYQVKRNLNPRTNAKLTEWIQPLLRWPLDDSAKKLLGRLGLVAQLCLFSKRGGKE